eukprot:gnl/Spiro4/14595_TR7859_c0_g14_i1.p1 gnl/Spiro4/14595_TR7859_c0_g14~~gnl/Spiro4/14595_TR7859_c0_g14_i1.p1  ORF type:complete len:291 (-),score=98.32 gnl/Spiro4/14595_TR7859_c0_g14_i1:38-910(-)
MCRGGRMFAPTKIWRRWHRKSNTTLKRHAVAAALAASSTIGLVQARGHRIDNIPELPLVLSGVENIPTKTKIAVEILKRFGADQDVQKVKDSRKIRSGKGKMRNRRHVQRRGPLIIYNEDHGLVKAFRNIPGVELSCVSRLNLLQLAPGGHVGRLIIWTESAFKQLDKHFGSFSGYSLPKSLVHNADLTRIINSDEIQSVLKPIKSKPRRAPQKKNPLKNMSAMLKLNPHAIVQKRVGRRKAAKKTAEKKPKTATAPKAGVKRHRKTPSPALPSAILTAAKKQKTEKASA